jgi:hypothetical protein
MRAKFSENIRMEIFFVLDLGCQKSMLNCQISVHSGRLLNGRVHVVVLFALDMMPLSHQCRIYTSRKGFSLNSVLISILLTCHEYWSFSMIYLCFSFQTISRSSSWIISTEWKADPNARVPSSIILFITHGNKGLHRCFTRSSIRCR